MNAAIDDETMEVDGVLDLFEDGVLDDLQHADVAVEERQDGLHVAEVALLACFGKDGGVRRLDAMGAVGGLEATVAEHVCQQSLVPESLEVLEDVDVADVEHVDQSDGPHLQQEGETDAELDSLHVDELLKIIHAANAVDRPQDLLATREVEKTTSNITVSGRRRRMSSTARRRYGTS